MTNVTGNVAGNATEEWPVEQSAALARRLDVFRLRHRVPAMAAALVHRDGRSLCAASGVVDLSTGCKATTETVFAWYSLTKVLTATACVQEFERVGLDLDTPVLELLPDVIPFQGGRQRAHWEAMRVRHLLCHAAGFADLQWHAAAWFLDSDVPWPDPRETLRAVLARRRWLSRRPGSRYRYTNLGYAVLGEVLAEVSGRPFRELVLERVLAPLGATRASFDPPQITGNSARVARGYVRRRSTMGVLASVVRRFADGRLPGGWLAIRPCRPVFSPHGGLWGPIGDLVPVLAQHLEAGIDPQHPLHTMQQVHRSCSGRERLSGDSGLGWRVLHGPPARVSHGGRGPGYTAEMVVQPGSGRAVAVLGNATFDVTAVAAALLES